MGLEESKDLALVYCEVPDCWWEDDPWVLEGVVPAGCPAVTLPGQAGEMTLGRLGIWHEKNALSEDCCNGDNSRLLSDTPLRLSSGLTLPPKAVITSCGQVFVTSSLCGDTQAVCGFVKGLWNRHRGMNPALDARYIKNLILKGRLLKQEAGALALG